MILSPLGSNVWSALRDDTAPCFSRRTYPVSRRSMSQVEVMTVIEVSQYHHGANSIRYPGIRLREFSLLSMYFFASSELRTCASHTLPFSFTVVTLLTWISNLTRALCSFFSIHMGLHETSSIRIKGLVLSSNTSDIRACCNPLMCYG